MITLFNVAIFLILVLPFSESYGLWNIETDKLTWAPNYVFAELDLFIFFIPLSALTIGFQILKFNRWRKTLLILHIVQCCAYSMNALLTLGGQGQYYMPSWGQLVMITLGPIILVIWSLESNKY